MSREVVLTLKRLMADLALERPLIKMDAVDMSLQLGLSLEDLAAVMALEPLLVLLCSGIALLGIQDVFMQ